MGNDWPDEKKLIISKSKQQTDININWMYL
jgi:hypothetical protein